jgi:hypothetical protein
MPSPSSLTGQFGGMRTAMGNTIGMGLGFGVSEAYTDGEASRPTETNTLTGGDRHGPIAPIRPNPIQSWLEEQQKSRDQFAIPKMEDLTDWNQTRQKDIWVQWLEESRNTTDTLPSGARAAIDKIVNAGVDYLVNPNLLFRSTISPMPNGKIDIKNPLLQNYIYHNYEDNRRIRFPEGFITDQNSDAVRQVRMGLPMELVDLIPMLTPASQSQFRPGYNSCGWIAAYNALLTVDAAQQPAEIVRWLEGNDGLIADGLFGVNPLAFDRLFADYGIKSHTVTTATKGKRSLDDIVRNGSTAILGYWNDYGNKNPFDGAHYISVTWDRDTGKFIAHNAPEAWANNSYSIDDFIKNRTAGLISLTVLR